MSILEIYRKAALPGGRALIAAIFIVAGLQKITGYAGTAGYMEAMGVPGGLLPLVILTELGGGLALLLGWQTRWAAFLLAGFSVLSGILFHLVGYFSLEGAEAAGQLTNFLKNLAIAGGLGYVSVLGGGAVSIDALLERGRRGHRAKLA